MFFLVSQLTPAEEPRRPATQVISHQPPAYHSPVKHGYPPVLWIIGGPGSNKAALCDETARDTGWAHVSLGRLLRSTADITGQKPGNDIKTTRESITEGELVPFDIVMKVVEAQMGSNSYAPGILMDGYPRDMEQITEFEVKVNKL